MTSSSLQSLVTADWRELVILQCIIRPSIAHCSKQLDQWCSTTDIPPVHHPNQPYQEAHKLLLITCPRGSRGPDPPPPPPPELPSGVHAKHKNPVRIFFVEGVWGYTAAVDELAQTPSEPSNPPMPLLPTEGRRLSWPMHTLVWLRVLLVNVLQAISIKL